MIRSATLLVIACSLAAVEPAIVPMGYTRLDQDGTPQGVVVALTRAQFTSLVEAAAQRTARPTPAASLAIGPGTWTGRWRDGRWTLIGRVPVAALGEAWGDVRLRVPGTVTAVRLEALAGATLPPTPAWRVADETLMLGLKPGTQATIVVEVEREAPAGRSVALAFPSGGTLSLDLPESLAATDGDGRPQAATLALPLAATAFSLSVDRIAALIDPGSLGLEQVVRLQHRGDRVAWTAGLAIDGQRAAPGTVTLIVPAGLEVLTASGAGLSAWQQRAGQLTLRWGAGSSDRTRRLNLAGVIVSDAAIAPLLTLPEAARGGGSVGVVDAGPVRWTPPEATALRRIPAGADERFRLAWDGADPGPLALAWTTAAERLIAASDALLVIGPDRWRAELALTLSGSGLADHLRLSLPAPWRIVAVQGATSLPDAAGSVVLRAGAAFAAETRLVVRCEAPVTPELATDRLPAIAVAAGAGSGRSRWLVADRASLRASLDGPAADADALAADLARAGIRPRPDERPRRACELRPGATASVRISREERRARIEAAHYLVAGVGTARWACRLDVRPEQGALDQVRVRLPAGARLIDRRGEAVSAWSEADGWLTATFAAPLDHPTSLELGFAIDWSDVKGRDHLDLAAIATEPALAAESIALAEDEDAGQLVRHPDGLEERAPGAVVLPLGVAAPLLAGRTWTAAGAPWRLTLERERLDPGLGVDGVATLVDTRSAIDPDGRLVSRATWYAINRSRSALELKLPAGCDLWEVRVGGQPVRARTTGPDRIEVPVSLLRPGEAATRIQVSWSQLATAGDLRPLQPVFPELRVMRALWRFTAPPGTRLAHVDGWDPVAAGDATGARVEVLADELKRLKATGAESGAVRARLGDQLQLLDQELADHLAVLERLGQDPSRWAGDVAVRQVNKEQQQQYQDRNGAFNDLAVNNRQELQSKLGKLSSSAKAQSSRRSGLLLDGQAIRWGGVPAVGEAGPDYAPRRAPEALPGTAGNLAPGNALGAGTGSAGNGATAALTGVDLLPDQTGDELTLRADTLGVQPVLRLSAQRDGWRWLPIGLGGAAVLGALLACVRRKR